MKSSKTWQVSLLIGNRRVKKPKFCHLTVFPKKTLKLCPSIIQSMKFKWNFQKIFSRVVSFMVLSKICENETFLEHSLKQVAWFLQKMALYDTVSDWHFWPSFCHIRAQIRSESVIGVLFPKIGQSCGFKYILVISNLSKTESGLILTQDPDLCAKLKGLSVRLKNKMKYRHYFEMY